MLNAGDRIDEWVVDGPLGSGGTASVYRCHNASAERIVAALKVLDTGALVRADARARLAREGEVLHELDHPGIVRVHSVRPGASPPYLVMSLVEGERLAVRIQEQGPQTWEQCMDLLEALTEAVAYLHERGIQHRDLKPANILLRANGSPVLVDFGLVLEDGASRLTQQGLAMGTVSYVPPEWATPASIDPVKWDVYSLGTVFWEVIVGRRAFPLPDDMNPTQAALEVMSRKRGHPPLDPGPDAPFFARLLIRDMTHPDPAERPPDAGAVLERMRGGEALTAVDPVDLFRTPMPTWQQQEAGPTLDRLATSEVPMAPEVVQGRTGEVDWWTSFTIGAMVGGGLVALFLAAALGWYLGRTVDVFEPEPAPAPTAPADMVPVPTPPSERTRPVPAPVATPAPVAEPALAAPSGPVTARAFGTWLEVHPDWAREAAIAGGRADEGYLKDWAADPGVGPAIWVSWSAASAFCTDRGGLAPLDAEPHRWEVDDGHPYMELRQADGKPAWRASDGRTSTAVDAQHTNYATGLRCLR